MTKSAKCNLFVIGNNGAGKTTLINNLIDWRNVSTYKTNKLEPVDWIIQEDEYIVNVEIKERPGREFDFLSSSKSDNFENSLIIIVANSEISLHESIESNIWRSYLNNLPQTATVIAVVNHFEKDIIRSINFTPLNRKYPFLSNIYEISPFKLDNFKEIDELKQNIQQIIINACTDRLDVVRNAIHINKLRKDTTLDLGKSSLTSLYEVKELFNNTHLKTLILSNEWGEYNGERWERKVSINHGRDNVFSIIPSEISNLKNLKILICGGNWKDNKRKNKISRSWHIKETSTITELRELSILNLSNCKIVEVGEINNLKKLEKLYLNNNQISTFPDISNLTEIRDIYLSNNNINNAEFAKNLKSIKTLDLHSNKITDLTSIKELISRLDIQDSKWENNTISISHNPLTIPTPELIAQGKEKVLAYLNQYEAEQRIDLKPFINKDIKLILVGNSNVGKSSLVRSLKKLSINKEIPSTHWMVIENWNAIHKGEKYNVRIFDFGGQEYYHDTHHLFFSNKTAYLLLWEQKSNSFDEIEIKQNQIDGLLNLTRVQGFPLEYWLDSINFHLRKKNKTTSEKEIDKLLEERNYEISKSINLDNGLRRTEIRFNKKISLLFEESRNILVTQNKVDTIYDKCFINQKELKNSNSRIFDFTSISVHKKKGLSILKDQLFEIFNSISILGEEYLGTWGEIKRIIENDTFHNPYTLDQFHVFCNDIISELPELKGKSKKKIKEILFSRQDVESFAQYLNDIGILLYYPENENLKDNVFLNQKQVLGNIYNILLGLDKTRGEFNSENILKSLNKNSVDKEVENTINLMLHFKIIFEHPAKINTYIAPLYLPKEASQSLKIFSPLFCKPSYRYQYKNFIHKNVILDFFHYYGKHALKENNNIDSYYYWREGIILNDEKSNEIIMVKFISANNSGQNAHIDVFKINTSNDNSFLNKVIKDLDIINEDWDTIKSVATNGVDFVPLDIILDNEQNENWIFNYNEKLFKLSDFKEHLKNPSRMKKIFISYSKQDLILVNKFIEHLSALQIDGLVSHWYCTELTAGSEWNSEIQSQFDEADIVCFMISPNFMKTKYIHDHEIAKAFVKKEKDPNFKIVPIILDFCRWTTVNNNLSQYTALPYTAKPIVDFSNENMAWYIVQECLRLLIVEDLNPLGENFYKTQQLPSDVLKIYERIIEGRVDKN